MIILVEIQIYNALTNVKKYMTRYKDIKNFVIFFFLLKLMLYISVNKFSIMSRHFPALNQY